MNQLKKEMEKKKILIHKYLNNLKNKNNYLISPNINITSSQQISKNGSLILDPSIKEKKENLRRIKIERKDKIDSRLLAIDEKIKKDKEEKEKQKKYEKKVKLFREKELEKEKQRKKYIL